MSRFARLASESDCERLEARRDERTLVVAPRPATLSPVFDDVLFRPSLSRSSRKSLLDDAPARPRLVTSWRTACPFVDDAEAATRPPAFPLAAAMTGTRVALIRVDVLVLVLLLLLLLAPATDDPFSSELGRWSLLLLDEGPRIRLVRELED